MSLGWGAENARPENAVTEDAGQMMSENEGPNRSTGKCGTKMQDRKMRVRKMQVVDY